MRGRHFEAETVYWRGLKVPWPADAPRPKPGDWSWCKWSRPLWTRITGQDEDYARNIVFWGGRAGGKTYMISEYALRLAVRLGPTDVILAVREVQASALPSIKATIEDVAGQIGLSQCFDFLSRETRCKTSGTRILYRGVNPNSPQSIEALKGIRGVQLLIADEAQWLSDRGLRILLDTVIREPGSQAIYAMNPEDRNSPMQRLFVDAREPPDDTVTIRMNWDSNPFFSEESESRRKLTLEREPDQHAHVWLGECAPDDTLGSILTWSALAAATELWDERPALGDLEPHDRTLRVGVDLGHRGHLSTAAATCIGGAVHRIELLAVDDWNQFAEELWGRSKHLADALGCEGVDIAYDSAGDQAVTFGQALEDLAEDADGELLPIPVHFGGPTTMKERLWERGAPNGLVFANRSAQLATVVAQRALNSVAKTKGQKPPPDRLLHLNPDIDDFDGLMRELVLPRWKRSGIGRRTVEKDSKDPKRDPHRFDALALAMQRDSAYGLRASDWSGDHTDDTEEDQAA